MVIRPVVPDDSDALAHLARRSVAGLSLGFYDADQTQSAAECITTPDADLIADGTMFVAVFEGRIVGCGAWSKRRKLYTGSAEKPGSSAWLDPAKEPARIRAFFVDPDFARQGIARKIYEACRDAAVHEGFERFELMATLPGVPFYERLGFSAEEAVELDLTDGSKLPAVRMGTCFLM
jgi:GNAT superfamily N-acetyltransferase